MKKKYTENEIQDIVEGHLYTAMLAAFSFSRPEDGSEVGSILQMYVDKFMETGIDRLESKLNSWAERVIEDMKFELESNKQKHKKEIDHLKFRLMMLEDKND